MKNYRVITKLPDEDMKVTELENGFKGMQDFVGGLVEYLYLEDGAILCAFNEEGKLMDMKPNLIVGEAVLCGPVLFIRSKGQGFASLTDEDIEQLKVTLIEKPKSAYQKWLKDLFEKRPDLMEIFSLQGEGKMGFIFYTLDTYTIMVKLEDLTPKYLLMALMEHIDDNKDAEDVKRWIRRMARKIYS